MPSCPKVWDIYSNATDWHHEGCYDPVDCFFDHVLSTITITIDITPMQILSDVLSLRKRGSGEARGFWCMAIFKAAGKVPPAQ